MDIKKQSEKIPEEEPLNKTIKNFVLEHPEMAAIVAVALTQPIIRELPKALAFAIKINY